MLINLNQSKAIGRVDHWFLVTVLETARFESEIRKRISMLYHKPAGSCIGERKAFGSFSYRAIGPAGLTLCFPFYMFSLLSPCSVGIVMRRLIRSFVKFPLPAELSRGLCVRRWYHCPLDILAVKKAIERYEEVAGTKINIDKSKGLQLGVWSGGVLLPGLFPQEWWTRLHPRSVVRARPPAGVKLVGATDQGRSAGGYLASKAIVLKEQGEGVRRVHRSFDPLPLVRTSPV